MRAFDTVSKARGLFGTKLTHASLLSGRGQLSQMLLPSWRLAAGRPFALRTFTTEDDDADKNKKSQAKKQKQTIIVEEEELPSLDTSEDGTKDKESVLADLNSSSEEVKIPNPDAKEDDEGKDEAARVIEAEEIRVPLPKEVVVELDKFIVGQKDAKKAVAIALRNRWRRHRVEESLRDEIIPKNILMIGPTGVGKTEVARRLAKVVEAPFIKVEATKFTEVGFHGRDVDQIIRDLLDNAIQLIQKKQRSIIKEKVKASVNEKILDILTGQSTRGATRTSFETLLEAGELEGRSIEIDVVDSKGGAAGAGPDMPFRLRNMMSSILTEIGKQSASTTRRKMTVAECRPILIDQETEKELQVDMEQIIQLAKKSVEQDGIVFIDEVDKIVSSGRGTRSSADASDEGVQRDLLPIIEGSEVSTKHGAIDTSKILFIASGAFHTCKPSDLLAELQGRLPIRVTLQALGEEDLYRILTEPQNNLAKQQVALMATEGMELVFSDEALRYMAKVAADVNAEIQNIGARRLHTVMEMVVEDLSFDSDKWGEKFVIDKEYVHSKLGADLLRKSDLSNYVL